MKKRILFIVNVDWFFLSHRLPIAIAAQQAGYEIHIACQFTDKGKNIQNYGFILHELLLERSGTSMLKEAKTFFSIRALLKTIRPDIIHAITIKPVLYSGLASRFTDAARVASISGLGFVFIAEGLKASFLKFVVGLFYKLALKRERTKVIFQNLNDKNMFINQGLIKSNDAVIVRGSGVDLTKYEVTAEPNGLPVVILLARLLVDKGVLEFVEAAQILKSRDINCRMVLVGDVDENPKSVTLKQIEKWVSEEAIEYWGFTDDVNATYAKSNIVVLPSYREGLPKSLIEAAACGRAVITTDVPGCRDAITAGETGLLVPVKNATALANAIAELCRDPDLRQQLGNAGRKLAEEQFDINSVVSRHLILYKQLLER